MKTIKQIADEIGVSKQAVHQKRKSKGLSTALQPFTSTVDGVVYITVDGETLIKQAFSSSSRKAVDVNIADNQPTTVDALVSMLQNELYAKNKLIDEQQQTIGKLTDALERTTESLQAAQALHAGTMQKRLLRSVSPGTDGGADPECPESPKVRFFDRFFAKKQ